MHLGISRASAMSMSTLTGEHGLARSGLHENSDVGAGAIFEADLLPELYAGQAGRNAQQAVVEVKE
jgi:hypothetical protein